MIHPGSCPDPSEFVQKQGQICDLFIFCPPPQAVWLQDIGQESTSKVDTSWIGGAALALILSYQNKNKNKKIKIKKHLPLLVGSHLVQSPLESLATVSVAYDLVGDLFHINQPAHILQKINPWPGRRKQKNTYIAGEHQGLTIGSM